MNDSLCDRDRNYGSGKAVLHDQKRVWHSGQPAGRRIDVIRGHAGIAMPAVHVIGDEPQELAGGVKYRPITDADIARVIDNPGQGTARGVYTKHATSRGKHEIASCGRGHIDRVTAGSVKG